MRHLAYAMLTTSAILLQQPYKIGSFLAQMPGKSLMYSRRLPGSMYSYCDEDKTILLLSYQLWGTRLRGSLCSVCWLPAAQQWAQTLAQGLC